MSRFLPVSLQDIHNRKPPALRKGEIREELKTIIRLAAKYLHGLQATEA